VRYCLRGVLSTEEAAHLIESTANLRHRTILMTLHATCMRRAEDCRLQAQDIDSARMMAHIRHVKGGKDRDIPLSSALLRSWTAEDGRGDPNQYLWITER
jgi:integrase/recombinase XerD